MIEVTNENYGQILNGTKGKLLVEFYSPTCVHCKQTEAGIAELAETDSETTFAKLNVMAYPQIAELYEVTNLPTLLFLRDGALKNRLIGFTHKLIVAENLKNL